MNTAEISYAMSTNRVTAPVFRGVFACNEVPPTLDQPGVIIINTDKAQEPGAHWTVFYQENENEFFDSQAKALSFYGPAVETLGNDKRIISRTHQIQSNLTTVCGQYCMFFFCRANGESFVHIVHLFTDSLTSNDTMVCQYVNFYFDMRTKITDKRFMKQVARRLNY